MPRRLLCTVSLRSGLMCLFMVIIGGSYIAGMVAKAAASSPPSDEWVPLGQVNPPRARLYHTTVWTGSEMIVWGGVTGSGNGPALNDGARYNPKTQHWTPISNSHGLAPRLGHVALWTGSEMIIWGGNYYNGSTWIFFRDGALYNPTTDTWRAISMTNAPNSRWIQGTVKTANQMVVWGGALSPGVVTNTGGRYDPGTDTWLPLSTTNSPSSRTNETLVWTGSELILWGGRGPGSNGSDTWFNSGGRYNPNNNSWAALPTDNAPSPRSQGFTAVWTDSEMIVFGGESGSYGKFTNTGGRYNPTTNQWVPLPTANAPSGRQCPSAVWTGDAMLVWGGGLDGSAMNDGALYYPPLPGNHPPTVGPVNAPPAPLGISTPIAASSGGGKIQSFPRDNPILFAMLIIVVAIVFGLMPLNAGINMWEKGELLVGFFAIFWGVMILIGACVGIYGALTGF